jgi:hypothetical protein
MNLLRRHIGRRVAGVGVGVALLVLGLEAPAFAAPVATAISPTSGPATTATSTGCVVAITGTGFDQAGAFAISTVKFTGSGGINTVSALFHVVSDTEIWTTVPTGALTGAITVSDGDTPPATSNSPVFTITTGASPDPCGPTITGFTPTCGVVGTVVTITGTNLLKTGGDDSTTPVTAPGGGTVLFNPYTSPATHTGVAESPTKLSVNVAATAKTGPIKVTTFSGTGGTVTSTGSFTVATAATECAPPTPFARSITLRLRDALVARGKVSAADATAPAGCTAAVPVKIQRRRPGGAWRTVGSTTTSDTGAYRKKIRNRHGKYRSLAPKLTLASGDVCSRDVSNVVRH